MLTAPHFARGPTSGGGDTLVYWPIAMGQISDRYRYNLENRRAHSQSRAHKFEQSDKWIFCLTAA